MRCFDLWNVKISLTIFATRFFETEACAEQGNIKVAIFHSPDAELFPQV
jgi:hypothetical protein